MQVEMLIMIRIGNIKIEVLGKANIKMKVEEGYFHHLNWIEVINHPLKILTLHKVSMIERIMVRRDHHH